MRLSSKQQVAERLHKSTRWVDMQIARGQFPAPVQLGGDLRWIDNEVDDWILAQPRGHFAGLRGAK